MCVPTHHLQSFMAEQQLENDGEELPNGPERAYEAKWHKSGRLGVEMRN